jgi:hypothetical protein
MTPASSLSTTDKIGAIGAIADAVLKPLSGANDASQGAQEIAATAQVGAQIAEVAAPQYAKQIELAVSLEPVAYHAFQSPLHRGRLFNRPAFHMDGQHALPFSPLFIGEDSSTAFYLLYFQ